MIHWLLTRISDTSFKWFVHIILFLLFYAWKLRLYLQTNSSSQIQILEIPFGHIAQLHRVGQLPICRGNPELLRLLSLYPTVNSVFIIIGPKPKSILRLRRLFPSRRAFDLLHDMPDLFSGDSPSNKMFALRGEERNFYSIFGNGSIHPATALQQGFVGERESFLHLPYNKINNTT